MNVELAVLGDPIDHSLSPVLHRAAYDALGAPWAEWGYDRFRVARGTLGTFLDSRDEQWRGFSVTAPLKEEVLTLARTTSDRAKLAGAANTLVRQSAEQGDGWFADNTDIPGAISAIRERWSGPLRTATILGAGATAVSIGLALAEIGVDSIYLLARTPARAEAAKKRIETHGQAPRVSVDHLDGHWAVDVVVSTIPVSAQSPSLVNRWADTPVVFDVVYDPWPTPLTAAATGTVISGFDLLVHQALLQVEIFTGHTPDVDRMRTAGEEELARRTAAHG